MRGLVAGMVVLALLTLPSAADAGVAHKVDFVSDTGFSPEVQRANFGNVVHWDNQTGTSHTATSYEGVFDTGTVGHTETSANVSFPSPGRYEYFCDIHSN